VREWLMVLRVGVISWLLIIRVLACQPLRAGLRTTEPAPSVREDAW
jgi:hypothetical protein